MTKEELVTLISNDGTAPEAVNKIKAAVDNSEIETYLEQYDPKQHKIFDKIYRPDKTGKDDDGKDIDVPVTRIAVALQKLIVKRAASFLCGNPIELIASPEGEEQENLLAALKEIWKDNKLDYKSKTLAKLLFSETQCAELWYVMDDNTDKDSDKPELKVRVRILAASLGDDLYPVYDATGDMIAFGRGYEIKEGDKTIKHFDVYTDDTIYECITEPFTVTKKVNTIGKIPVIFYKQDVPDWYDVQEMIEQLEKVYSNSSDTNEYFGSPMAIIEGALQNMVKKGQTNKLLVLEKGAKASYLTWDQAPEPVKMEMDNLLRQIYTLTDTPDISFEQMKSIGGTAPSGFALKMLFLGAHLKASEKEEIFGESIQRRINFLIAAIIKVTNIKLAKGSSLEVTPKFEYYLPKNDSEKIDNLTSALQGGIISKETAIRQNPLVEDPESEIELVKDGQLDETMNI
jgi:SPP1 family phage portal protein